MSRQSRDLMEPDNTADTAASMDLRSKRAFFEAKSQQSSHTKSVEHVQKRPPAPKSVSTQVTATSTQRTETRPVSPQKEIPSSSEMKSPQTAGRPVSPQKETSSSSEMKSPQTAGSSSHKCNEELTTRIKEVSSRKSSGFSPNDLEVFQKPMCLISAEGENVLKFETKAAEQIAKIDWPIVVVSVVGLYRTGKSYLMNRLAESTKGFALGDTIESTTKGIWVWCKMHPKKLNTVLLLLDTEGLGDVEKGDPSHDNKIFTLATLLCNCLVYNMKGAFDQDAVSKLTLKLSKGGKKITEDEYLEQSLAIQEGKNDKFNKPRECIQKYFPVRKCFTFPVPGDGDVLENLETLEFSELSNRFREATIRFVNYIYDCKPKDLLASKPINGLMFTTLATHYVTAIRHGAVPDVDDAFSAAAKIENVRIGKEALEIFQKQMETVMLPVPSKVLRSCYKKAQQIALAYLRDNVVHDKAGECEINAQMEMDNIWKKLKEENTQKVKEMCDVNIQAYKVSVEENIENKTYEVSGGHRLFQEDIEKMKKEFINSLPGFEENEILLTWLGFMKTIEKNETQIIKADDALSEKEKEDESKRNKEKMDKLIKEQENSKQEALEKQRKDMEEHKKKLQDDRQKKQDNDRERYEELLRTKLEKEYADKEIKRLKKERNKRKDWWFFTRAVDAAING